MMNYDNLTLLVSSCDKYAVCWAPFCHGLKKYWPGHPGKLVFITNDLQAPCGQSLQLGEDRGWSQNLLTALDRVETDFILYAQEDYWIKQAVPDETIQAYLTYLENDRADMIRLYPAPGPDKPWETDPRLGTLAPDAKYRASLQMALWRKTTLASLLDASESPWQFEVRATERSRRFEDRFLCVSKRRFGIDYVFTAIVNGYWSHKAYAYADDESLTIPFEALPKKPLLTQLMDRIRTTAYKFKRRLRY